VTDIGNGLVNDAKQMYYLGIYSHKVASYQIPDNIESIYILNMTKDSEEYFYVGVVINGKQGRRVFNFQSEIPLSSDTVYNDVSKMTDSNIKEYVPECGSSRCTAYSLSASEGKRNFKTEIVLDSENRAVAMIYPILS
jgi:hypothetical protein